MPEHDDAASLRAEAEGPGLRSVSCFLFGLGRTAAKSDAQGDTERVSGRYRTRRTDPAQSLVALVFIYITN